MIRTPLIAAAVLGTLVAAPLRAQDIPAQAEESIYGGDWVTVGAGAIYSPSYSGSNDYEFSPIPAVQGSIGGVSISPRGPGLAFTIGTDNEDGPRFSGGLVAKINRDRVSRIKDPVVEQYGTLRTGIEVGPTVGVTFPKLLNPFDSFSLTLDSVWDVNGASKGMALTPAATYFTPLSRGMAASLALSATRIDNNYADYYYSVPTLNTLAPADTLPAFKARGGWEKAGVNLLYVYDFDGNLLNGGWSAIALGGYSHLLGDAKRTPFTSIRGSSDQWMAGLGIGYTF